MEKKWDTIIAADLKRLFVSGIYVPLVTKGLKEVINFENPVWEYLLKTQFGSTFFQFCK